MFSHPRPAHPAAAARRFRLLALIALFLVLLPGALVLPSAAPVHATRAALTVADGSLIRDSSNGRIYLVWANRRHWIDSPAAFSALGYDGTSYQNFDSQTIASIPDGTVLSLHTVGSGLVWPWEAITASPVHLQLGSPSVAPGQTLRVDGSGFFANESVTLTGPQGDSRTVNADGHGSFSIDFTVAASTPLGLQRLYVQGAASGLFGVQVFHTISGNSAALTATPNPVGIGDTLSVSGTNFRANETVDLFLAGGAVTATVTANGAGSFGPVGLVVASSISASSHTVRAFGTSSSFFVSISINVQKTSSATATPTPTLTPAPAVLTVTPTTVVHDERVQLAGSGFAAGETVVIRVDGSVAFSSGADGSGHFTAYYVANISLGGHDVTATGATSGRVGSGRFTVIAGAATPTPTATSAPAPAVLVVTPGTVVHDERVQLAGSGFAAGETVVIRVDGSVAFSSGADGSGHFTAYYVANISLGGHDVTATGATSGRVGSGRFTVVAQGVTTSIVLSMQQVHRGSTVYVSGAGYQPGETVLIRFRGVAVQAARVDTNGHFAGARFVVPGYTPFGSATVEARGQQSGRVAASSLQVVPTPQFVRAQIQVYPTTVHRGDAFKVYGQHYAAGELVLVFFRGALIGQTRAGGSGDFGGLRFRIAHNSPYGFFPLVVMGAQSKRSARVYVHIVAVPSHKSHKKTGVHLVVSPAAVKHNARVTVRGQGFMPGEIVLIRVRGRLVEAPRANSHGDIGVAFRVRAKGKDAVLALGSRSGRHVQVTLVVY